MLRLQIVGHPADRMRTRGISRADVESALLRSHTTVSSGDSVSYWGPACNGEDLKVVVLYPGFQGPDIVAIIKTVAWRGVDDQYE